MREEPVRSAEHLRVPGSGRMKLLPRRWQERRGAKMWRRDSADGQRCLTGREMEVEVLNLLVRAVGDSAR